MCEKIVGNDASTSSYHSSNTVCRVRSPRHIENSMMAER